MCDSDIEHIEVMSAEEVKYKRSEFASVVFHNVADTYPVDAHVECSYKLTEDIIPATRDWVGLYKVGWMSARDYIYYEWAPLPKNYEQGKEAEAEILFQAHTLPNDDGEFYQFCYVSSAGQIRGASTPFQFKKPTAGDYVEVEDEDSDMLIVRSRTLYLQEKLQKREEENQELHKNKDLMSREVASLADKITQLQKKLEKSDKEKKDIQGLLESNQRKLDEMLSDANDMTLVHDELRSKVKDKEKGQGTLKERVAELQGSVTSLQAKMKVLQSEKDELEGRNKILEEEMDLYKNHLSKSENSAGSYVKEIELLNGRLEESSKTTTKLRGRVEELEVALSQSREAMSHLKKALHQEKVRMEEQSNVTKSEKENVSTLTEKLRNAEDKLATEESTKDLMRQELQNFREAQEKMSQDLAASRSECHNMKTQICRMEEDFSVENSLLKTENRSMQEDMQKILKEKEKLQTEVCNTQEQLGKVQESFHSTTGPMYALSKANVALKKRLTLVTEKYTKLAEEKKQARLRENELNREITDLKERIHMCSEEYKQIYKENRKMQKKTDKLLGHKKLRDSKSESEKMTEKLQTSPGRSLSVDASSSSSRAEAEDMQDQLARQKSKTGKYKQLYKEEKERLETLRAVYHEQLQAKDAEIEQLHKRHSPDSGQEQRVRLLEKYLDEKEKLIEDLNQKLRDCRLECEMPKPAKRSTVPKKVDAKTGCPPEASPARCHSPELLYGNPYKEESQQLSAQLAAEPVIYSLQPAGTLDPPQGQMMARHIDDEGDVFVDASPQLPQPLEPEVLPEAKWAAVLASRQTDGEDADELQGHCYGMPRTRAGIIPSAPPAAYPTQELDTDDIIIKCSSGKWLIDSNVSESRRCPSCPIVFPAEMKEEDFMEHVFGHMGRICPMCKMQVDDSVESKDFEYHVHCCIGQQGPVGEGETSE